jgi:hypothetical protein
MADEIKSDLYFLYEADPLMSGQNEAFAFKDNYVVLYDVFARRSFGSFHMLQGGYTGSDARDYMNRMIGEVFHMFKVRPGLTSSQKTEMKSILHECVSEEGWFELKWKTADFSIGNRKNVLLPTGGAPPTFPIIGPHSQTNGA